MLTDGNALALAALVSALETRGASPLTLGEWKVLRRRLDRRGMPPEGLLGRSAARLEAELELSPQGAARLTRLLDRAEKLEMELYRWESRGVYALTLTDERYPATLKNRLGEDCPPLFYYSGSIHLLARSAAGYVGVRDMLPQDAAFAACTVGKTVEHGHCVVSGGARGVDSAAQHAALERGEGVVSFLCTAIDSRLRPEDAAWMREGRVLLLSLIEPGGEFTPGGARLRNRYIYAHSRGTVVVHSKLGEGGTWGGANEALTWGLCPVLCWDTPDHRGNQALIRSGAIPIGEDWDGDLSVLPAPIAAPDQTSLFEDGEPWSLEDPRWEQFYREEEAEYLREQEENRRSRSKYISLP